MSRQFRLKNLDEKRNYFLEEIQQNELMSRKHRKVCTTLTYIEHFLIWMYFNFCFCLFVFYYYSNYKFCHRIIAPGIKKYKLMTKKKKEKHDKIVLLAKSNLNGIDFLISEALISKA